MDACGASAAAKPAHAQLHSGCNRGSMQKRLEGNARNLMGSRADGLTGHRPTLQHSPCRCGAPTAPSAACQHSPCPSQPSGHAWQISLHAVGSFYTGACRWPALPGTAPHPHAHHLEAGHQGAAGMAAHGGSNQAPALQTMHGHGGTWPCNRCHACQEAPQSSFHPRAFQAKPGGSCPHLAGAAGLRPMARRLPSPTCSRLAATQTSYHTIPSALGVSGGPGRAAVWWVQRGLSHAARASAWPWVKSSAPFKTAPRSSCSTLTRPFQPAAAAPRPL